MHHLLAAISLVVIGGIGAALHDASPSADIDPATGLPAREVVHSAPPAVTPGDGVIIQVLWDASHGAPDYLPSGLYSSLTAQLAADGFQVTTTHTGLGTADLASYQIIVICAGSAMETAYTAGEAALLKRFVRKGGGLLVMADNVAVPDNLEVVTDTFSTEANEDSLEPIPLTFTAFSEHPIFEGIESIFFQKAGSVSGTWPAVDIARTDLGEPVVVSVTGLRVILLGDINVFDNNYKPNADNELFATNVFRYLAGL